MDFEKYVHYQLSDFLEDDSFVQWVIHPNEINSNFWQNFLHKYPEKTDVVEKASALILTYRHQHSFENEERKSGLWQKIEGTVREAELSHDKKVFRLPLFTKVAAAVLVIALASLWIYNSYKNDATQLITLATSFGEIKSITLPDQTLVTLNANSKLHYNEKPGKNKPREVWIEGEAYFAVKHLNKDTTHIAPSERFIVHSGDVNIEVLGTSFNVKARHGKTDVALITGKIRIDYNDVSKKSQTLTMAPGDYVQYADKKIATTRKLAKPEQVAAWKENELSFTDATVEEIMQVLEDRFDYKTTTKDTTLLQLKIEGDIVVNNVAELLDVITTTLDIKIEQSAKKHITISK